MVLKRLVALLTVLCFLTCLSSVKADDAVVRGRLQRISQASALDAIDARPWHVTIAVMLFDDLGKNPIDGTIVYSKSGADWLRVITIGSNSETVLRHDGHTYSQSTGSGVPYLAQALLDEFLHAGPAQNEMDASEPELRKQTFGKVALDCIMMSQRIKMVAYAPLGLFPTYCMLPNSDRLVASYDFGSRTVTINSTGRFLDHEIPMKFSIAEGQVVAATATVSSLTTFAPAPDMFLPAAQQVPVADIARISSGVMQGQILTKVQPSYPEAAKASHISGTVVLRAIIGRDGRVHILRVMSAPEPDLAIAALAAVRKWRYKPYLLNGEPVEVDTTVIVNFNLNPY